MQAWLELYKSIRPVAEMKEMPENEEWCCYVQSPADNWPVKIGGTRESLRYIPREPQYYRFFQEARRWWMIPCVLWDGSPIGFVLRNFDPASGSAKFSTIYPENRAQLLYGLNDFKDFDSSKVLGLCEGPKERIVLSSAYPYFLGLLGNKISPGLFPLLVDMVSGKNGSGTIVLALDSDEAGRKATEFHIKKFREAGVSCKILSAPTVDGEKTDWGNLHYLTGSTWLQNQVNAALKLS